jgi:hypothetical protein
MRAVRPIWRIDSRSVAVRRGLSGSRVIPAFRSLIPPRGLFKAAAIHGVQRMQGVKPWQLAVIVIGLLVGGGLITWQGFSPGAVKLADSIMLVDVTTGEIFEAPLPSDRTVGFPAKSPTTGKETLLPATQIEGKWFVGSRYREFVKDIVQSAGATSAADASTFEVKSPTGPTSADVF